MRDFLRTALKVLKLVVKNIGRDRIMKLAAALAYYTISSIGPLLLIVLTLVGWIYGDTDGVQSALYGQIQELVGTEATQQVQEFVRNRQIEGTSVWATVLGIGLLVVLATLVFVEIQDSINQIWRIQVKPERATVWRLVLSRLLSLSLIVGLGFLLLVSLVVNTVLQILGERLQAMLPGISNVLLQALNFGATFLIITTMFAVLFKVLPDARIRWRDVLGGAVATSLLFIVGKFAIGLYLGQAQLGSSYGAAGSLVVLLTWVYYSAVILYIGAEFTWARARILGHRIQPASYATFVEIEPVEVSPDDAVAHAHAEAEADCAPRPGTPAGQTDGSASPPGTART